MSKPGYHEYCARHGNLTPKNNGSAARQLLVPGLPELPEMAEQLTVARPIATVMKKRKYF